MSANPEIVSIGNLNLDLIGKLESIPKSDEKVLLKEFGRWPGGGGANFAAVCQKHGLSSGFIGCVGDDAFGSEVLEDLRERGVDTSHVRKVRASTGFAFIFLTPRYERLLIEHRGANSYLKPSDLAEDYLRGAKLLHASSVTPEIATAVGERAQKLNLKASLDLGAELSRMEEQKLLKILENFDICFMNEETFEDIFEANATKQSVLQRFPKKLEIFVVTIGSEGALVSDGKTTITSPSYDVDVKDTTGAGDTFAAIFDKHILGGASLEEAVKFAAAGAALKVQHVGARKGVPDQREIEKFLNSIDKK